MQFRFSLVSLQLVLLVHDRLRRDQYGNADKKKLARLTVKLMLTLERHAPELHYLERLDHIGRRDTFVLSRLCDIMSSRKVVDVWGTDTRQKTYVAARETE